MGPYLSDQSEKKRKSLKTAPLSILGTDTRLESDPLYVTAGPTIKPRHDEEKDAYYILFGKLLVHIKLYYRWHLLITYFYIFSLLVSYYSLS